MVENYRMIGLETGWSLGATVLFTTVLFAVVRTVKNRAFKLLIMDVVSLALGLLLLALSRLPFTITVPLFFLTVGFLCIFSTRKTKVNTKWQRPAAVFSIVAVPTGLALLFLAILNERIVVADDAVTYTAGGEVHRVDRAGLEVHAVKSATRPFWIGDWWSWTSYASDRQLGPHIMGSEWYWRPNGLVRGDDLARYLAEWAGTKPKYRVYERE